MASKATRRSIVEPVSTRAWTSGMTSNIQDKPSAHRHYRALGSLGWQQLKRPGLSSPFGPGQGCTPASH
ncbi:hypothetical protein NHX12_007343 [Muraenolepis orangiensis]|uniref:Uncharacterized protein n=1 Tax=Muraenolepis orangiensis TaxID=630683 RepID=A0A9Q0DNY5_9TELE|nr:hypothetical protein NHX12_007343 [Muraenolepis orangiensis]